MLHSGRSARLLPKTHTPASVKYFIEYRELGEPNWVQFGCIMTGDTHVCVDSAHRRASHWHQGEARSSEAAIANKEALWHTPIHASKSQVMNIAVPNGRLSLWEGQNLLEVRLAGQVEVDSFSINARFSLILQAVYGFSGVRRGSALSAGRGGRIQQ